MGKKVGVRKVGLSKGSKAYKKKYTVKKVVKKVVEKATKAFKVSKKLFGQKD